MSWPTFTNPSDDQDLYDVGKQDPEFMDWAFTDREQDMLWDLSPILDSGSGEPMRHWVGDQGKWVEGPLKS